MSTPEISLWLSKVPSEESRKGYTAWFQRYLVWTDKTPVQLLEIKSNGDSQAELLLDRFVAESKFTDRMKLNIVTSVRSFYNAHYKALAKGAGMSDLTVGASKPYRVPTVESLQRFINGAQLLRDKAIIALLASTFIREGSLLQLRISHIEGLWEEISKWLP